MSTQTADSSGFILRLGDDGEGIPLPLALSGYPATDDAGQTIHYRKMKVADVGDWVHCATGDDLPLTKERVDSWAANHRALKAAGRIPFVPTRHTFEGADAKDNQGFVLDLAREGEQLFATVALHGDEALKIAAKSSRSVGIKNNPRDAKGNVYAGEWLHHLALTPSPALPNLGGMMKIAASDEAMIDVPVYYLNKTNSPAPEGATVPPTAQRRKGCKMTPEIAIKARTALSLSADVTDEKLDDAVAEKAIALSVSVQTLTAERDALKTERDAAKSELTEAKGKLALSADGKQIDDITAAMFADNISARRELAIRSGAISEANAKVFDKIVMKSDGKPTMLALSACGDNRRPLGFEIWDALSQLSDNPIKTGNKIPRGAVPAEKLELDADGKPIVKEEVQADLLAEARRVSGTSAAK